ncbi:MAG TPA: DUF362 domain-containing protein [Candidatus Norongarragalinales archaeon]|jgi:uncharacterized protein (DUF362 family)|nr:DUF362 domain-containing protein [Candidatus Norongarragalinales archaeon]
MKKPVVALARSHDRKSTVRAAIHLVKNELYSAIKKKGKRTLFIKVNTVDHRKPEVGTQIDALRGVLDELHGGFKRVIIGDNSVSFTSKPPLHGYAALKKEYKGLEFSDLSEFPTKPLRVTGYHYSANVPVSRLPEKSFFISLALPKTHGIFSFTGACKNVMGCVPSQPQRLMIHKLRGEDRLWLHRLAKYNMLASDNLARLINACKPDFGVLDAWYGLAGNYDNHLRVDMRCAIASTDPLAADSVAVRLAGLGEIPYLQRCEALGVGAWHLEDFFIATRGVHFSEGAMRFKPHANYKYQMLTDASKIIFPVNLHFLTRQIKNKARELVFRK